MAAHEPVALVDDVEDAGRIVEARSLGLALEDQIDKQKTANKQIEDQIAMLKDRLKADVCTIKDPLGKTPLPSTPAPAGALPERKT